MADTLQVSATARFQAATSIGSARSTQAGMVAFCREVSRRDSASQRRRVSSRSRNSKYFRVREFASHDIQTIEVDITKVPEPNTTINAMTSLGYTRTSGCGSTAATTGASDLLHS